MLEAWVRAEQGPSGLAEVGREPCFCPSVRVEVARQIEGRGRHIFPVPHPRWILSLLPSSYSWAELGMPSQTPWWASALANLPGPAWAASCPGE